LITRIWRGDTRPENADAYQSFVTRHVFTALTKLEGHCGAYLLRRAEGARVEFLAVTLWESLESVRAFAGDSIETAVIEPEARAVLSSFDDFVRHYDVAYGNACAGEKP
jgi:heme-degrading monooxygenase HmoA